MSFNKSLFIDKQRYRDLKNTCCVENDLHLFSLHPENKFFDLNFEIT